MIKSWGIDAKSHLSGLTEDQVGVIIKKMESPKKEDKKVDKKVDNKTKETKVENVSNEFSKKKKKKKKKNEKSNNKKFAKATKNKNLTAPKEEVKGVELNENGDKVVKLEGETSLKEFAEKMGINPAEIVKKLFLKGQMLTINSPISLDLAEEIALEYDILVAKRK